jgi:hypothetical protein
MTTGVSALGRRRGWAAGHRPRAVALVLLAVVAAVPTASAVFTGTTSSAGNAWSAAASFPTYPQAIAAQSPWAYHRLEESASSASTSVAADTSGNGRSATYSGTTNGPVTWWKLDEAAGTVATDASGGANPATLSGVGWTAGASGSAVVLDGTSAYGTAVSPAAGTTSGFTVSAWVKLSSGPGATDRTAVSQGGTHAYGFQLGVEKTSGPGGTSGKWMFAVTGTDAVGASEIKQYSSQPATVGVWTQLTGVYDTSTGRIYLYVGGTPVGSANRGAAWNATGAVQLGRALVDDAWTGYFPGTVDDVRIYGRALSATEAASLAGTHQLTAAYDFSAGAGATATDDSGWGNTGTLGSGTSWTASGHLGNAVSFDSTADAYLAGGAAAVTTSATFSVATWVNLADTSYFRTAVSQDATDVSGFYLQYEASLDRGAFGFRASDDAGSATSTAASSAPPALNVWTHLAGTYDSSDQQLSLYVNGVLQSTAVRTGSWNATGALQVGRAMYNGVYTDNWSGAIDSVRVYRSVLSGADVANLYADTAPASTWTEANLGAGAIGALQGTQQGLGASTAVAFSGSGNVYDGTPVVNPAPFTLECWFRAAGAAGGAIAGLGTSTTGMAAETTDRLLYLNSAREVVFRVDDGAPHALVSPGTYADGSWHHVAASLGASGMRLYLDGALVASNGGVTTGTNVTGYWRWGGVPLHGLADRPASDYLIGSLDELAVYETQLTDAEIAQHFHADH